VHLAFLCFTHLLSSFRGRQLKLPRSHCLKRWIHYTGCDNSIVGAYKATMESEGGQARTVGIAVIQEGNISADGQDVKVSSWSRESGSITALDQEGNRIVRFEILENGDLTQDTPAGKLTFKRFDL
ncbi:hypothetical protein ACJU29_21635, partial [Pseudomonas aeruginosa]|uniref:hypothetical protein n=4 Tax=Pseudomonas aeruginosa TaxID=287 RepID=UPI003884B34E